MPKGILPATVKVSMQKMGIYHKPAAETRPYIYISINTYIYMVMVNNILSFAQDDCTMCTEVSKAKHVAHAEQLQIRHKPETKPRT